MSKNETKKVYCIDCEHCGKNKELTPHNGCFHPSNYHLHDSAYHQVYHLIQSIDALNGHNQCENFKKK